MLGPEEIAKRFGTTATPFPGTENPHDDLRRNFISLAQIIDVSMDDSREKSLALTELESASMWAHKCLAQSMAKTRREA